MHFSFAQSAMSSNLLLRMVVEKLKMQSFNGCLTDEELNVVETHWVHAQSFSDELYYLHLSHTVTHAPLLE